MKVGHSRARFFKGVLPFATFHLALGSNSQPS